MVVANLSRNVETARKIIEQIVEKVPIGRSCECQYALKDSILTSKEYVAPESLKKLGVIISKYM